MYVLDGLSNFKSLKVLLLSKKGKVLTNYSIRVPK